MAILGGVFIEILGLLFFIFLMFFGPVEAQKRLFDSIDDTCFKRVKISKLSFLFRAIGKQSASKHGIVKSLLYVQIQGYVVAFASLVFFIYSSILKETNSKLRFTVILLTFLIHLTVVCTIMGVTGYVSNRREKKKELSPVELLNRQLINDLLEADKIRDKGKREEEKQRIYANNSEELIKYYKENEEIKKQIKNE